MAGYLNSQGVGGSTLTTTLLNALDLGGSPNPTLIDTVPGVTEVVDSLEGLPVEPPSIYIDLEGVNLSRLGTISILQVYIHTTKQVYLIDVLTLREKCFSTCGESGRTLKDIFESSAIPKVFFDVRNDSDALYHHFQINLAGVLDLQLMELATRNSKNRRLVSGLSKCIEIDAPLSTTERRSLMQIKNKGIQLFKPENGGSYAVFNERPLREDISLYCAQDVQILPRLWAHYSSKITPQWKLKVISGSKDRVEQSQSPSYNGKGRHKALAPAGW